MVGPARQFVSRYELPLFFLVTFVLSWGVWSIEVFESWGLVSNPAPPAVTRLLGAFGPTLAAVLLTAVLYGRGGLRTLGGGVLRWRVPLRWYVFALLFPPGIALLATAISVLLGSPLPDFSSPPLLTLYPLPEDVPAAGLPVVIAIVFLQTLLVGSPLAEELGWRGFALPRLQSTHSAFRASLIVGVIWGLWHLPLYLVPGSPISEVSAGVLLFGIVADSVLFTWLFNSTRGSLLLALIFHASIAVTGLALSSVEAFPAMTELLTWGVVLLVVARFGAATLSSERKKVVTRMRSVRG